jgi:hypothetical protein
MNVVKYKLLSSEDQSQYCGVATDVAVLREIEKSGMLPFSSTPGTLITLL